MAISTRAPRCAAAEAKSNNDVPPCSAAYGVRVFRQFAVQAHSVVLVDLNANHLKIPHCPPQTFPGMKLARPTAVTHSPRPGQNNASTNMDVTGVILVRTRCLF